MSVRMPEVLNERAVTVIDRVSSKLTGTDFIEKVKLPVADQVNKLIEQATSHENLCQCYVGWCPFW
jgi:serine/threonine-protein kinase mTOR